MNLKWLLRLAILVAVVGVGYYGLNYSMEAVGEIAFWETFYAVDTGFFLFFALIALSTFACIMQTEKETEGLGFICFTCFVLAIGTGLLISTSRVEVTTFGTSVLREISDFSQPKGFYRVGLGHEIVFNNVYGEQMVVVQGVVNQTAYLVDGRRVDLRWKVGLKNRDFPPDAFMLDSRGNLDPRFQYSWLALALSPGQSIQNGTLVRFHIP